MKFHPIIPALLLTAAAGAQGIPPGLRVQPGVTQQKPSAAIPLPATAPTLPAPAQAQFQPPTRATLPAPNVRRAQVTYTGSLLTVTANNSSLNQILREIARQTGITISGGVTEERVFGTYGPSDLPTVLAVLLDGTGSNMELSGDTPNTPQVLTLTPRQGGVSPPSPSASASDDVDTPQQPDLPPQLTPRTNTITTTNNPGPQPINPPQPNASTPPGPVPAQADAPTPPPANTTTDQSPNGVKTPQQIYDQLMKLQSQQPKPPQ